MSLEPSEAKLDRQIDVFLIHGTWAPGARWIQKGSKLRTTLRDKLDGHVNFIPIKWASWNRFRSRNAASERLREAVDSSEADLKVLIGHSHGGYVALRAIQTKSPLDTTPIRLVTLNTPFFVPMPRSTHVRTFHALSLMVGTSFLISQYFYRELGYFSGLVGALIAFGIGYPIISRFLDGPRLAKFIIDQIDSGYSINTRILSFGNVDDEALGGLQTADTIASLPFLMLHIYLLLISFILVLFLHYFLQWDFRLGGLQIIGKVSQAGLLGFADALSDQPMTLLDLIKEMFRPMSESANLQHLNEIGWGRCPVQSSLNPLEQLAIDSYCNIPAPARWIAIVASSVDYLVVFWTSLAAIGLVVSFVIYVGAYGAPLTPSSLLAAMVIRFTVSPAPLGAPHSQFVFSDSLGGSLRHSNLYNDEAALDAISIWVNSESEIDIILRMEAETKRKKMKTVSK